MTSQKPSLDALKIDRSAAPPDKPFPWLALILIVLLIGGGAAAWAFFKRAPVAEVQLHTVRESAVSSSGQRTLLNSSGYVTPRRLATVSSKVTGRVLEVLVEEGMVVTEGQPLARLDGTNIQKSLDLALAQLAAARSDLNETQVRLKEADLDLRRVAQLAQERISSAAELDRANAARDSISARLEAQKSQLGVAEKQVAVWEQQMDDLVIRAPFSGVVVSKNAQPGEMISPVSAGGGFTRTGICTIVDMESLEVEVDVNESYINRVVAGQPAEAVLDSYPDWKIPAKVIAIIPTADRQKATVRVRVGFEKLDPRILPQMGVKVAFRAPAEAQPGAATRSISIPKTALHEDGGRSIVWVAKDGKAERRAVTVERSTSDEAILSAGLRSGEVIVQTGGSGLKEGVRIKEAKR